jgi:hypothetical protein
MGRTDLPDLVGMGAVASCTFPGWRACGGLGRLWLWHRACLVLWPSYLSPPPSTPPPPPGGGRTPEPSCEKRPVDPSRPPPSSSAAGAHAHARVGRPAQTGSWMSRLGRRTPARASVPRTCSRAGKPVNPRPAVSNDTVCARADPVTRATRHREPPGLRREAPVVRCPRNIVPRVAMPLVCSKKNLVAPA